MIYIILREQIAVTLHIQFIEDATAILLPLNAVDHRWN
jgi:hypothetical protein